MIASLVSWLKKDKNKQAKEILLKEYFNPKNQKKAIKEAAKKSAEDQNAILTKYRQMTQS